MTYTVDLENKKITYDKLPPGHLIALRKVFEPQGYVFQTMEEYAEELLPKTGLREQLEQANLQHYTSYKFEVVDFSKLNE